MTIHTINAKGSNTTNWPTDYSVGDMFVINYSTVDLLWKVLKRGVYKIKAYGARGAGSNPGYGGVVEGIIHLEGNDQLVLRAYNSGVGGGYGGSAGSSIKVCCGTVYNANSGGNGSAGTLVKRNNVIIMAAGGGGGSGGDGGYASSAAATFSASLGGKGANGGSNQNGNNGRGGGSISSYSNGGSGGDGGTASSPYGKGGTGGVTLNSSGRRASSGSPGAQGKTVYDGSGGGGGGGAIVDWSSYIATGGSGGGGYAGINYIQKTLFNSIVQSSSNNNVGFIEITVLSILENKFLIQDGKEIKKWEEKWISLGPPPTNKAIFDEYGMEKIESIITPKTIIPYSVEETEPMVNGRNYTVQVNKKERHITSAKIKTSAI